MSSTSGPTFALDHRSGARLQVQRLKDHSEYVAAWDSSYGFLHPKAE